MSIDWQAFRLTLELALTVSAILLVIGLPLAYWIAFSRWRWKFLVEATVALPIVLPPTVLGFYVLVALGSQSPVGRWWQSLQPAFCRATFRGILRVHRP
jgi:molybdate transport system permease protein